jgi:poly(glycerol-phosphate) alpha-glucosyltransferase
MYFFINPRINQRNSGVEHAAFKRLHLFKQNGKPAKIVVRNYNRFLTKFLNDEGISSKDFVSMFDFFQEAEEFPKKAFHFDDLALSPDYEFERTSKFTKVFDADRLLMEVGYIAGTNEEVNTINYYDQFGNVIQTDFYDWRGFKSMAQYYDGKGQVTNEFMFTPKGKLVYASYYGNDKEGKRKNTLLQLVQYQGKDYYFKTLTAFFSFFLDELNMRAGADNTFISDRRTDDADAAMFDMKTSAKKFAMIHSTITIDANQPLSSPINPVYEGILITHVDQLSGIIVATKSQAYDLQQRFPNFAKKIKQVPVSFVTPTVAAKPLKSFSEKTLHKIISVARLSEEKRPQDLVHAMAKVLTRVPDATLEIVGYSNGDEGQKVSTLIKKLGLEKAIQLTPYTTNQELLAKKYETAQLHVLASRAEGSAQVLVEAQSYGLPQVAYDVNYGPNEVLVDGENGYLVPSGDRERLADALVRVLLSSSVEYETMERKAKTNSLQYSEAAVWTKWLASLV